MQKNIVIILLIILTPISFYLGKQTHKKEVIDRAKTIPEMGCYTELDIEIIVFGESQE